MKNKGVFTAIILIIVIGVFTTIGTRRFIAEKQAQMNTWPESAIQSAPGSDAAGGMAGAAQSGDIPEAASEDGGAAALSAEGKSGKPAWQGQEEKKTAGGEGIENGEEGNAAEIRAAEEEAIAGEIAPYSADDMAGDVTSGAGYTGTGQRTDNMFREAALAEDYSGAPNQGSGGQGPAAAPPSETKTKNSENERKEGPVSPLTGISGNGPGAPEGTLTREDYQKRLEEIDALIADMKQSDLMSNTDSMSSVADYEYKLWDSELNRIYQALIQAMSQEEAEALKAEERSWLRTRDQAANQAASKYKGGTMERLEYAASLAISTRTRAYELLEEYGSKLDPN